MVARGACGLPIRLRGRASLAPATLANDRELPVLDSLQSRAQPALGAFAGAELDPAGNMGIFVLSRLGGDHSRLADVIVRYRANGGDLIVASHMLAQVIVAVAVTVVSSID
jgi:hypothetical protein